MTQLERDIMHREDEEVFSLVRRNPTRKVDLTATNTVTVKLEDKRHV